MFEVLLHLGLQILVETRQQKSVSFICFITLINPVYQFLVRRVRLECLTMRSPQICLHFQIDLLRPLWRFSTLEQFPFRTPLPCSLQEILSSFGICVGLNSVYFKVVPSKFALGNRPFCHIEVAKNEPINKEISPARNSFRVSFKMLCVI